MRIQNIHPVLRLILAFTVFSGMIATLIIIASPLRHKINLSSLRRTHKEVAEQPSETVFYQQLGGDASESPKKETKSQVKPLHSTSQFTIEVKNFQSRSEADSYMENLAKQNIDTYLTPTLSSEGRVTYRVRMGLFPSYSMAEKFVNQLKSKIDLKNEIVKLE